MRKIKFRGKLLYIEEWTYGSLIIDESQKIVMIADNESGIASEVDKETVGQYTGLKDRNMKEIYEGDVVTGTDYPFIDEGKQNYVGIVVFYDDVASFGYEYQCVRKDKRGISNGINNEFEANENLICENLEVIGNIYDNLELLEEGE